MLPYTLDANDFKFVQPNGWLTADDFLAYLVDTLDVLAEEGAERPRLMNVGLHCRVIGRPGRAKALDRFLAHVRERDDVWVATREQIARHWLATHPPA